MIVPSHVEVWHLEPKIDIGVEHLALCLGTVLLFPRASYHDELVAEPRSGMAMSWMLHGVAPDEVEPVVDLDLKRVIKCLFILLVVTTTNHEELTQGSVYDLEVMGEVGGISSLVRLARSLLEVDLKNVLRVLLEDVDD